MNEEFIKSIRLVLELATLANKKLIFPPTAAVANFNAIDIVTKFVDVAEQCSAEIRKP